MSNTLKEEMLGKLGIEVLYLVPFSEVKNLPPEAFVEEILKNTLRAEKVFCGYNYHFGAGGTAGKEKLKALCRPRGIQVCDLPPVTLEGAPVSSTRIRKALEKGGACLLYTSATGVLPILIGSATKAQDLTPDSGKEYVAGFRLGVVTDTEDSTGTVKETFPVTADEKRCV